MFVYFYIQCMFTICVTHDLILKPHIKLKTLTINIGIELSK